MSKFVYAIYGLAVLIGCTVTNLDYAVGGSSSSSSWNSRSGGFAYGGSGGSTGGFFSGAGHK